MHSLLIGWRSCSKHSCFAFAALLPCPPPPVVLLVRSCAVIKRRRRKKAGGCGGHRWRAGGGRPDRCDGRRGPARPALRVPGSDSIGVVSTRPARPGLDGGGGRGREPQRGEVLGLRRNKVASAWKRWTSRSDCLMKREKSTRVTDCGSHTERTHRGGGSGLWARERASLLQLVAQHPPAIFLSSPRSPLSFDKQSTRQAKHRTQNWVTSGQIKNHSCAACACSIITASESRALSNGHGSLPSVFYFSRKYGAGRCEFY